MSVRKSVNKTVEEYNCFGGHCPECDDFLFTWVLSYNPPIVKQTCLGCDFERDISEEIRKAINYKKNKDFYEADPKLQVSEEEQNYNEIEKAYRNAFGKKSSEAILHQKFREPSVQIELVDEAGDQLKEMVKETDPVKEYIDDMADSISLSYAQIAGAIKDYNPKLTGYYALGTKYTGKLEKSYNHVRICKICGYMIPDDIPVTVTSTREIPEKTIKTTISVRCPCCHAINNYKEKEAL